MRYCCGLCKCQFNFELLACLINFSPPFLILSSNINKEKTSNGTEVFNYLPPFPMKGTGWHRCAYVLYEHTEPIDYNTDYFKKNENENSFNLNSRSFKTMDFYLKFQAKITPVSLLFFQCQYDPSVKHTFHHILSK